MKIRITAPIREIREITPSYRIYPDRNQTTERILLEIENSRQEKGLMIISGRVHLEIDNPEDKATLIDLLSDICDRQ